MDTNKLLAVGVLGVGAFYLMSRDASAGGLFSGGAGGSNQFAGAGNAPLVPNASSVKPSSIGQLVGGIGATATSALPFLGLGGAALGLTTAGIGLGVAIVTYALLKQRASMQTNDVRDQWQRQFIALHDALGLTPLTAAQTAGSGPGSIELAECIFFFDHDGSSRLWQSIAHTQDERQFRAAAANVETFFRSRGVPVLDV